MEKEGLCEYCKKIKEIARTVAGLPICYQCLQELRNVYGFTI